ncbi:MAG: nucleotidyltransferase domain-containing protein [Epsilonproteobacteria bacterium]|nr:nucleotidyltransferase domain-containing protein [Campylobacterota bacterium]
MRLNAWEVEAIKKAANEIFGDDVKVMLFGSRVDDSKKGGDIDLYVITKNPSYEKKTKFWIKLQEALGEQKIDIILSKDKNRKIEQVALKEGIEL